MLNQAQTSLRIKGLLFIILLVTVTSIFRIPASNALTTGNCTVTVTTGTGVVLVNNGGYCYLAFSSTGANSFVVPSGVTSSAVMVVAGGGAGGAGAWGGGGGAGGVVYSSSYPLTPGATMNLSVGSGGAVGAANLTASANRSNNGQDSWINSSSTFVAKGGGAGASYAYGDSQSYANGSSGGSGGGGTEHGSGGSGGTSTQTTPTYATTVYGSSGGASAAGSGYVAGAGGGGATGVGIAMTSSGVGGNGGTGTNFFASWFTAIGQFGSSGYIAGGGGGGANTTAGTGGSGGGGKGGGNTNYAGTDGGANTGGGGGGASYNGACYAAGAGGTGLIIFKFAEIVLPAVINTPSLSGTIYKGMTTAITVTMDSPGKVRFIIDNKRIPACLSVQTTGTSPNFSATCNWKPPTKGFHYITAILTPSNLSQSAKTSVAKVIYVVARSTNR